MVIRSGLVLPLSCTLAFVFCTLGCEYDNTPTADYVSEPSLPAGPKSEGPPRTPASQTADTVKAPNDEELFADLLDNHWRKIFPAGGRNVGGPQFFKYIYENLATTHDLFQRYNRFYCGVSGSIVSPKRSNTFDVVKAKGVDGKCVYGRYHRCCWPCSCDLMKYARAETIQVTFPKDPGVKTREYTVLTIGDPCYRCEALPCPDLPPEVTTYACQSGVTSNGLRVANGKLTNKAGGRLVFALLETIDVDPKTLNVDADLMKICGPRFGAGPAELDSMGGMGNIFVNVARVNSDETYANTTDDLCE